MHVMKLQNCPILKNFFCLLQCSILFSLIGQVGKYLFNVYFVYYYYFYYYYYIVWLKKYTFLFYLFIYLFLYFIILYSFFFCLFFGSWKDLTLKVTFNYILIIAVKWLIAIHCFQHKHFCLHNMYVYCVYLLCINKYTHMHVYISEKYVIFIY